MATLGVACCLVPMAAAAGRAEVAESAVAALGAPESIETRIGTLEFRDGVPNAETARAVYDTLDFTRALDVDNNSFRGASALAIVKGLRSIGAGYGDVVVFPELMDASSLFLTGNDVRDMSIISRNPSSTRLSAD